MPVSFAGPTVDAKYEAAGIEGLQFFVHGFQGALTKVRGDAFFFPELSLVKKTEVGR